MFIGYETILISVSANSPDRALFYYFSMDNKDLSVEFDIKSFKKKDFENKSFNNLIELFDQIKSFITNNFLIRE